VTLRHPIAGLALCLPASALALTIKVPADHATIQEAVDTAQTGDVIQVAKGTYTPFVIATKSDLTIKGKGGPVVDGSGGAGAIVTIANSTGIVLDRLVIQNSGERGVLVTDSTDVVIRRTTVVETDSDAIRAWGSARVMIDKCRVSDVSSGVDFSAEDASPASVDSVVQKSRFERLGEVVDLDGSGHRVEKNRITDNDHSAITLDETATGATIAKNKMTNVDTAIDLRGSGHVVEKNTVKGARDEGIVVVASGCRVEKNKLDGVTDDAIDLEGDDNEIIANKVTNTGDNGIEIAPASGGPFPVTGNLIERNKIKNSGGNGIFVETPDNTFRRNTAKKSAGFDLLDQAGEGANVYDGNKFGTESIQ
jgi:hypothetical protein